MKKKWIITVVLVLGMVGLFLASTLKFIQAYEERSDAADKMAVYSSSILVKDLVERGVDSVDLCSDTLVILHYWATWCKPCVEDFKSFQHFYDKNKEHAHILVISEEPDDIVQQFLKDKNFDLPFVSQDDIERPLTNDVSFLPSTYFVKKCKIQKTITGKTKWDKINIETF